MTGIQLILIGGVAIIFLYYLLRLRNVLFDFVIFCFFVVLAVYFILFPESTSKIANKLGVGRGTDLLFYICILFFLFVIMKLFARIRNLEKQITLLIREEAKHNALPLKDRKPNEVTGS